MKILFLFVAACMALCSPIEASDYDSQLTCRDDSCYVDSLVNEIQNGNATAYASLGDCYRDGRGVEKSLLNMVSLYVHYKMCTGNDRLKSYCDSVEESNPVRILNDISSDNVDIEHLSKLTASLRTSKPLEADALNIFINNFSADKVDLSVIQSLEEIADRGSETAVAMLSVYVMKQNNNDIILSFLLRYGDKYPMLLNEAGLIMWNDYKNRRNTEKVEDIDLLKRAESCLLESFNRGFIDSRYASCLKRIYREYDRLNILYDKSILPNIKKIRFNDLNN